MDFCLIFSKTQIPIISIKSIRWILKSIIKRHLFIISMKFIRTILEFTIKRKLPIISIILRWWIYVIHRNAIFSQHAQYTALNLQLEELSVKIIAVAGEKTAPLLISKMAPAFPMFLHGLGLTWNQSKNVINIKSKI